MPTTQELEDRVAELRQDLAAERFKVRESKQKISETKGRFHLLQQEISRLQGDLLKQRDTTKLLQAIADGYGRMKKALEGVLAERYKETNPLGHDCKWCSLCTTRVWQAANVAVGRKA